MTLRITHNCRHLNLVAAILVAALIAAACGGEDAPAVIDTPSDTAATTTVVETPIREEHPCDTGEGQIEGNYCLVGSQWWADAGAGHWVESDEPPVTTTTVAAMTEEQIVEIQQEIAEVVENASPEDMPTVEVAEQVIEAADEAAPESELTLGICTQWVADPEFLLNEQQTQECAAMLAAAVEACEGLDCFPEDTAEPESEQTPTTTAAPEPEEATTTTAPPEPEPEPEEATTTTAPPEPEPEPEETTTTTTAPPEPEQPAEEPEAEAAVEASTSDWVAPYVGLVPEVHPDTPPNAWERGDLQPGVLPIETPRSTGEDRVQVSEWINWMGRTDSSYTRSLMADIKWAVDYLGAHPACVIHTYYDRVVTSNEVTQPDQAEPGYLRDLYGWHNCATVIDPFIAGIAIPEDRDNDIGLRLSDAPGITLAERCRTVLPEDIQLEAFRYLRDESGDRVGEPGYYPFEPGHAGCDEWVERVESDYWFVNGGYPECFRSAELAGEWMEHYHDRPVNYGLSC